MKDFYDILFLASNNTFTAKKIKQALDATFAQRETDIEKRYFINSEDYISAKKTMWKAFLRKINSNSSIDFSAVVATLKSFMEPVIQTEKANLLWHPQSWRWEIQ